MLLYINTTLIAKVNHIKAKKEATEEQRRQEQARLNATRNTTITIVLVEIEHRRSVYRH